MLRHLFRGSVDPTSPKADPEMCAPMHLDRRQATNKTLLQTKSRIRVSLTEA